MRIILAKNPCRPIKPIKYQTNDRDYLTQIELETIRKACKNKRDRALIEFLYSTGCRVSEAINAKIDDVDFLNCTLEVTGKGNKTRTVYINAKAFVYIKDYLSSRTDDSEYLFVKNIKPFDKLTKDGVEKVIRVLVKGLNLNGKHITPHSFRHTTATTAVQNGMPITDIQKMLGHTNIETTMIYAKTSNSNVRLGHLRCVV